MMLEIRDYIPKWMKVEEDGEYLNISHKIPRGKSSLRIKSKIQTGSKFWFQLGVYASEGYRPRTSNRNFGSFDVCNSDKKMMSEMSSFLDSFGIDKKIRKGHLHIKIRNDEKNLNIVEDFKKEWSKITGIPKHKITTNTSFYKKAKELNKDFIGIFHIRFGNIIFIHILRNILISYGLEWR